jgi:hypothetical protein
MGKETGKVKIVRFGKFEAENIWVCPDKLIETLKVVSWPEVDWQHEAGIDQHAASWGMCLVAGPAAMAMERHGWRAQGTSVGDPSGRRWHLWQAEEE